MKPSAGLITAPIVERSRSSRADYLTHGFAGMRQQATGAEQGDSGIFQAVNFQIEPDTML